MSAIVGRRLVLGAALAPCGKRLYFTEPDALTALAQLQAKAPHKPWPKVPQRAYRCDRCSGWHLTALAAWVEPT